MWVLDVYVHFIHSEIRFGNLNRSDFQENFRFTLEERQAKRLHQGGGYNFKKISQSVFRITLFIIVTFVTTLQSREQPI